MEQQNSATMQSLNIEEEEEETNLESSNSTKKGGLLTMPFIIGTIHTHTHTILKLNHYIIKYTKEWLWDLQRTNR